MNAFINPPVLSRPAPLWSWNDKLEPDELRRQIREMVAQGWGGFFMHPRVGYTTHYLSDRWMEAVHACIDEARKLGVKAWIYDEDRWPSGFGGGVVADHNRDFRGRAMVIRPKGTERSAPVTDQQERDAPKLGPLGVVYGQDRVIQEVQIRGAPYVICEQIAGVGTEWFNGSTYPDLMNPEAVRAFFAAVHERYRQACGKDFGGVIPGVFTDEPLYLNNGGIDALGVPWSTKLPEFFRTLKGYDIQGHLPKLFLDVDDYRRVRFDFYDVASRLFRESFTRQYYQWCANNNLIFTGHFQAEDTLRLQAQWTGDVMAHYPWMHWPGIDQLERKVTQVALVKQLTSVTDQLNKPRAFCEAYGISGAQVSLFHRKWIADWLIALGINFINPHLFHYSLRGPRKRDCPPNIGYQAPWWPDERNLSDHLARLCAVMTGGKRRVDVLMLQPLSSVWCDYSPMQWDSGYAPVTVYDTPYQEICSKLLAAQIDFHIGNENIMAEHAAVEGDRLRVGQHHYRCVVLPPTLNLRRSTLLLLQQFLKAGGCVIVTGATPSHVDGVPSDVSLPGVRHATRLVNTVAMLSELLPNRMRAIDQRTGQPASDVIIHTRDHDRGACHLLSNTAEGRDVDLRIRLPEAERAGCAILDSHTGQLQKARFENDGTLAVNLAPAGSLVLLTGTLAEGAKDEPTRLLRSGARLGVSATATPLAHVSQFAVTLNEGNVLRVDDVELELAGERFVGPLCAIWKNFYGAPDGTPFRVTYRFHSTFAASDCTAIIDSAEHLDTLTCNGVALQPRRSADEPQLFDEARSWRDIALTRVPLPTLRAGENVVVLTGRKVNVAKPSGISHRRTQPGAEPRETQVEDLLVAGNFAVQQIGAGRYQIAPAAPLTGHDLTQGGAPFYCGRATYRCAVNLPAANAHAQPHSLYLELHGLEAASARIRLNGQDCGTLCWRPHMVDITAAVRAGANDLEIELATTPYNVMGPTHYEGSRQVRKVGPREYIEMTRHTPEHDLAPFGLRAVTVTNAGPRM